MTRTKKRILSAVLLVVLLFASSAVGVTFSWLSYSPRAKTNVFTFSDVDITLHEDKWDALADVPYGRMLYPGRTLDKDPLIENTGENSLYAFLEVSVPKAEVRLVNDDESIVKQTVGLFTYSVTGEGWTELEDCRSETDSLITRLYAYLIPLAPGERTTALFESITFRNIVEGDIPEGTKLTVGVNAYAVQTVYLGEQGADQKEKLRDAYTKYLSQKTAEG